MTRLNPKTLIFATHNRGKVEEVRQILARYGTEVKSAAELGLSEPVETETSFVGNARIKAHAAARATGLPALADDSGLCVDALGGQPGVYTADWAETPTGRDFGMAMARTHAALLQESAPQPWTARFQCTLVLAYPTGEDQVFEGSVAGHLIWPIRGAEGHGYDPMFVPEGESRTFAEMTHEEKNVLSHRGRALSLFVEACFT